MIYFAVPDFIDIHIGDFHWFVFNVSDIIISVGILLLIVSDFFLKKIFPNQVALLHGKTDQDKKENILKNFLDNKFKILVSTTIIEVGIDFPNANVIIIENANKFGLAQLHQVKPF